MRRIVVLGCAWVFLVSGRLLGQGTTGQMEQLPPPGYGSLSQSDLSLRVRSGDLDIRLVPLDERVTRLLARDAYQSLQGLVQSKQSAIDSLARVAGISAPGLALVSFFAQREGTRFDPQTLTLLIRNRLFRPRGIVPFSPGSPPSSSMSGSRRARSFSSRSCCRSRTASRSPMRAGIRTTGRASNGC